MRGAMVQTGKKRRQVLTGQECKEAPCIDIRYGTKTKA